MSFILKADNDNIVVEMIIRKKEVNEECLASVTADSKYGFGLVLSKGPDVNCKAEINNYVIIPESEARYKINFEGKMYAILPYTEIRAFIDADDFDNFYNKGII